MESQESGQTPAKPKPRISRILSKLKPPTKAPSRERASSKASDAGSARHDETLSTDNKPSDEAEALPPDGAVNSIEPLEPGIANAEIKHDVEIQTIDSVSLPKTLWEQACNEVEKSKDFQGFITKYQKILMEQGPQDELPDLATQKNGMKTLIQQQRKVLEEGRWGFMLWGRSFKVADIVSSIINGIVKLEGTMGTILRGSGEPHAAMVVAGVSVLLPLITHPAAQDKSALELLGKIFDRTSRYYVYEDILTSSEISPNNSENFANLRSSMQKNLVKLYVEILKAQIALARRFARSSFLQYGRDIVKFDAWETMQQAIEDQDQDLLANIQTLNTILGQASIKHYLTIETEIRGLNTLIESQAQITENEKNQQFRKYFSSKFSYQGTVDKVDTRIEGTNEWVAKDLRFTKWRSSTESATMLVKAGAGHGKSVLLKHLLENEVASSYRRLTVFFFFHRGLDLEESAVECMNAIILQILRQRPDIVAKVRATFVDVNDNTRYHFDMLSDIIRFCISDYDGEIVLVIDGLDECEALESPSAFSQRTASAIKGDDNRENLVRFFDWLAMIASTKSTSSRVKLLCSTRTGADTAYHMSDSFKELEKTELDLNAEEEHARNDLALYINAKVSRRRISKEKQKALSAMLIRLQQTSGSYLWLKLVFAILPRPEYESMSVERFEDYLVRGDSDKVDKQFSALLPTKREQQTLAKIIFSIVLGSRRPLTTAELIGAVEVVTGEEAVDLDRPEVLAAYCSAFVEINTTKSNSLAAADDHAPMESQRTVNFFHDRARTFLLSIPQSSETLDLKPRRVSILNIGLSMLSLKPLSWWPLGWSPKTAQVVRKFPEPTEFYHGFSTEYVDGFMFDTCVKYIKQKGSSGNTDQNLRSFTSYDQIVEWVSKNLKANPFMVYAAIQWINHLPFDETDPAARNIVSKQIHDLLDVSSTTFRSWFICNWRIWGPDMAMETFFGQYITAFVTDNLQPDQQIMKEFDLEDSGLEGAWLWWTATSDLEKLKTLMKRCKPGYKQPTPKREWISSYESRSSRNDFGPVQSISLVSSPGRRRPEQIDQEASRMRYVIPPRERVYVNRYATTIEPRRIDREATRMGNATPPEEPSYVDPYATRVEGFDEL